MSVDPLNDDGLVWIKLHFPEGRLCQASMDATLRDHLSGKVATGGCRSFVYSHKMIHDIVHPEQSDSCNSL